MRLQTRKVGGEPVPIHPCKKRHVRAADRPGLLAGGILGYLGGVLVGGVFLVADAVRRRFGHGEQADAASTSDGDAS